MNVRVGIIAYGSLISNPGWELENAIVERKKHVLTPFKVEFAQSSTKRGGAPTLVPVAHGGNQVLAHILGLNLSEQEAKDRLWRREVNKIGGVGRYVHSNNPGPNTLIIDRYPNFEGIAVVLAARFLPTISSLNPKHLADLAIESARRVRDGRDGITYLLEAKLDGIITPLSEEFEREILTRTNTKDLEDAVRKVQSN